MPATLSISTKTFAKSHFRCTLKSVTFFTQTLTFVILSQNSTKTNGKVHIFGALSNFTQFHTKSHICEILSNSTKTYAKSHMFGARSKQYKILRKIIHLRYYFKTVQKPMQKSHLQCTLKSVQQFTENHKFAVHSQNTTNA